MKSRDTETTFVTSIEEIEPIIKELTDMEYEIEDGETQDEFKMRVEQLHLPLISRLEGVKLEWKIPDYSHFDDELKPENVGEQVLHLNTDNSPIRDIIISVIKNMTIKA